MTHPNTGSPIHFTTADGQVRISLRENGKVIETWTARLIGYAVAVRWSGRDESEFDPNEFETSIQPVFIHEGIPTLPHELRESLTAGSWADIEVLPPESERDPWEHLPHNVEAPTGGVPMPEELRAQIARNRKAES